MELQDAQHGYVESRREQVRLQEELSMKAKLLRDTQIRSMHEMGEMKRTQELRVDEMSIQKLRENHETNQQLTSQLQQLQEQMNSMNSPGEFQDMESNYSGRLSHVSSQPEMIPSSRALLSRDKRLPLDTWNQSGVQENVCLIHPEDHPQRIQPDDVQRNREAVPEAGRTKTVHTRDDICTKAVDNEFHNTVESPKISMVGQAKTASVGIAIRQKFPNTQSFLVWKIRFNTQVTDCADFPSEAMLWIKEVEMVDSLDELKSSRSVSEKNFPQF